MANVAVAVSPVFDYVLADLGDEILILEKTLSVTVLNKAAKDATPKPYSIIKEVKEKRIKFAVEGRYRE